MNYNCPNSTCKNYQKSTSIIKDGHFFRKCDSRKIQRFKCKTCHKRFSSESLKLEKYHKKRRINYPLFKLLASGVSQRRAALLLGVSRRTVEKKLPYLGKKYKQKNKVFLERYFSQKTSSILLDDLITKENSKLKPLSVSIAVDDKSRIMLGAKVSQIPAFGHLSKIALKKYGYRKCHHKEGLDALFQEIAPYISQCTLVKSDEHRRYPEVIRRYFSDAVHEQFKSERAHVAGQGELKKGGFDPIYGVNHMCAMLRANINRLIRKTWCTTKDPKRLSDHLEIFMFFYNTILLKAKLTPS